jgi:hypothetical protein
MVYKVTTRRWAMGFVNEITADRLLKEAFAFPAAFENQQRRSYFVTDSMTNSPEETGLRRRVS